MRRATAVGLILVAGCNQIWGIGDVDLRKDGPEPAIPEIWLTTQITKTKDMGFVDQELDRAPIAPAPLVEVGRIGEPLVAVEYKPEGRIEYDPALAGAKWRLVYTLADGLPREVQWQPPLGEGHLVEALLGRAERKPVPPGSGYTITPLASPSQHTLPRVFTTGIWTEGVEVNPAAGATFEYDFNAKAISLSGPVGAPESARFDHAVLADFFADAQCRATTGTATFVVPDLVAGTLSPPAEPPRYETATKQSMLRLSGPTTEAVHVRLASVLGPLHSGMSVVRWASGYVPSLRVFGFSSPGTSGVNGFALPGPRMLTFFECTQAASGTMLSSPLFVDSEPLRARFPRVIHVEVVNTRMVGALVLRSGFSGVVSSSSEMFTSEFLTAAPTAIELRRGAVTLDLVNDVDGMELPAGAEPLELTLETETGGTVATDYFEVTLHEVSGSALVPQRRYIVTAPAVTLDPALLRPATEYAFEVRAYRGAPNASRGDFSVQEYPQYAATVFSRTFRTP